MSVYSYAKRYGLGVEEKDDVSLKKEAKDLSNFFRRHIHEMSVEKRELLLNDLLSLAKNSLKQQKQALDVLLFHIEDDPKKLGSAIVRNGCFIFEGKKDDIGDWINHHSYICTLCNNTEWDCECLSSITQKLYRFVTEEKLPKRLLKEFALYYIKVKKKGSELSSDEILKDFKAQDELDDGE